MRNVGWLMIVVPLALVGSCSEPQRPLVVSDPDLRVKALAIKQAVRKEDQRAIEPLIDDLDSDDPAVRFFAIEGLQKLTGERFGYEYYLDREQRRPAVQRWREWRQRQAEGTGIAKEAKR